MSSSEQKLAHTFHSSGLPFVSIPAPFDSTLAQSSQSDSSLIESDSDFVLIVLPTNTSVLLSPPTPVDLRSNFSNVALSSQASEESDILHQMYWQGKKRVHKIHRGRFQKVQTPKGDPYLRHLQKIDYHLSERHSHSHISANGENLSAVYVTNYETCTHFRKDF